MRIYKNRKAQHEYYFVETYQAGIVLQGTEVKSIRAGKVSFKDCYANIKKDEVWLIGLHISPYEKGNYFNHTPERKRKLLLNKREIRKLHSKIKENGLTLVPKSLYINGKGLVKVDLALAKGKHHYDKRDVVQKRDQERESKRQLKYFG